MQCTEFLLLGMKVYWDEASRGILLGDNTGDGHSNAVADYVSLCWGLNFNWLVLYIHTQLSICVLSFSWHKIWLSPDLPECNYWVSWGVPMYCSTSSHRRKDRPTYSVQGGHVSDMFIIVILFHTFKHGMMCRVLNVVCHCLTK